MNFVQNAAGNFASHQGRGPQGPPLPPPWVARWDEANQRWFYINERTGERTGQHPQPGYSPQPGHSPQPGYNSQPGYNPQHGYAEQGRNEQPRSNNHNLLYGAAGAAAGLVGGALLMHEGEKIRMHILFF